MDKRIEKVDFSFEYFKGKFLKNKSFIKGAFTGAILGFIGGAIFSIFGIVSDNVNYISIKKTDNVEQGFVIPSKLEKMSVENLDLTGKPETILKYDGKDYLFKVGKDGIPICVPYEIEPSKYIPPRIIIKE